MKPVIPVGFEPFDSQRIAVYREARIRSLAEGLTARDRKKSAKPRTKKPKKPSLTTKAQAALAGLDPEAQALLKATLGL